MVFEVETMHLAALGEAHGNARVEIYGAITVSLRMLPSQHTKSLPGFEVLVFLCVFLCLNFSKATVLPSSASSVRQGAFILGGATVT